VFSSCGSCTVTAEELPIELDLERTGGNIGELKALNGQIQVECGVFECTYEAEGLTFGIQGKNGTNGHGMLNLATTPLKKFTGLLCPKESTITEGLLEPLSDTYIMGFVPEGENEFTTSYEWGIEEYPLSSLEGEDETISTAGGPFEIVVSKLSLTVKCTAETGSGELEVEGTSSGTMTLTGCVVVGSEEACNVNSTEKSAGTIAMSYTTNSFGSESEANYDEVIPKSTLKFTGKKCGLPEELKMSGETAAEVPPPGEETTARTQVFTKKITEESEVAGLKLGENAADLIGEDSTELTGEFQQAPVEQVGITVDPSSLLFNPNQTIPIHFRNTTASTMHPNGFLVRYTDFQIAAPFTFNDPWPCKSVGAPAGPVFGVRVQCTASITCPVGGGGNIRDLTVKWEELYPQNNSLRNNGRMRVRVECQ